MPYFSEWFVQTPWLSKYTWVLPSTLTDKRSFIQKLLYIISNCSATTCYVWDTIVYANISIEEAKQSNNIHLPANKGHTCPVPRQSCGVHLRQVPHQTRPHEVVVETHIDHTYKEGNHVTKRSYFQKSIMCRFREVQNELFISILNFLRIIHKL